MLMQTLCKKGMKMKKAVNTLNWGCNLNCVKACSFHSHSLLGACPQQGSLFGCKVT